MTLDRHLELREVTILPSSEWLTQSPGWTVARLDQGVGYWRERNLARELGPAAVVVFAEREDGVIRASQLGPVKLQFFSVQPELLGGILTWPERNCVAAAAARPEAATRFFTAADEFAKRFARLCEEPSATGPSFRCRLLQLWADIFAAELRSGKAGQAGCALVAGRFERFINRTPEAVLQDCSMAELARLLRCSPRHLSRLFHKEFGGSLRARQVELRRVQERQLIEGIQETFQPG